MWAGAPPRTSSPSMTPSGNAPTGKWKTVQPVGMTGYATTPISTPSGRPGSFEIGSASRFRERLCGPPAADSEPRACKTRESITTGRVHRRHVVVITTRKKNRQFGMAQPGSPVAPPATMATSSAAGIIVSEMDTSYPGMGECQSIDAEG